MATKTDFYKKFIRANLIFDAVLVFVAFSLGSANKDPTIEFLIAVFLIFGGLIAAQVVFLFYYMLTPVMKQKLIAKPGQSFGIWALVTVLIVVFLIGFFILYVLIDLKSGWGGGPIFTPPR